LKTDVKIGHVADVKIGHITKSLYCHSNSSFLLKQNMVCIVAVCIVAAEPYFDLTNNGEIRRRML
jgi:hypothetical protein